MTSAIANWYSYNRRKDPNNRRGWGCRGAIILLLLLLWWLFKSQGVLSFIHIKLALAPADAAGKMPGRVTFDFPNAGATC